jgi:hypothetical protein
MAVPILLVAHPGHELQLHGWMARERPLLCILTDGSGGEEGDRTAFSRELAQGVGAACGPVFGPRSDRDWYAAIRGGEATPFLAVLEAVVMAAPDAPLVVADPPEGYNPMHDLAAALGEALAARLGARLATYPLMAPEAGAPVAELALSPAERAAKHAAALAYAPLAGEVSALLARQPDALDAERLCSMPAPWPEEACERAEYERIGRQRVAAGRYAEPIRFARHIAPLAAAIRAAGKTECGPWFSQVQQAGVLFG